MVRFAAFRLRAFALALLTAALFAGTARAQGAPPAAPEQSISIQLDSMYRRIPTCTHGAEAVEERDGYAAFAQSSLASVVAKIDAEDERVRTADGDPTPVAIRHLDLSGRGEFSSLHFFLTRLSLRNRLIDLERLLVTAEPSGSVRFEARLGLPCYEEAMAEAQPKVAAGNPISLAETRQQRTFETLTEVTLRSNPALVLEALAGFDRRTEKRALALTELKVGKEIELNGVIVANAARASVKADLEAAGFTVTEESLEPAGPCQKLKIRARIEPRESSHEPEELVEAVSGNGLFDAGAGEACVVPSQPAGRVTARGSTPAASALTLHLRDVDLPDLFLILHDLTDQSFIVDADVRGRIDVEVETATLQQILEAMKSVGLTVSSGALHRVSKLGKPAAKSAKTYKGEPLDMSIQNGDLMSTLCAMSSVAQQPVSFPTSLSGTANVFATNLPADQLLEAVIASAGLVSVVEKGGLFVGPEAAVKTSTQRGPVTSCNAAEDDEAPPIGKVASRLQEKMAAIPSLAALGAADLDLAALVSTGGLWKAYVYAPPSRHLTLLDGAQQLYEANVLAIGPEGVTIAGKTGEPTTLKLRP